MKECARFYASIILLLAILIPVLPAGASDNDALSANKLSIKPPYMSITVKQGESFKQQIQLLHTTDDKKALTVEIRIRDMRRIDNKIVYLDESNLDNPAYSVSHWATIEPDAKIRLPPNKWVTCTVNVTVPKDAELGEHVSVVNARTIVEDELEETGMQVVTSLSPAFFVLVTDPEGNYDLHRKWSLDGVRGKRWNGGDFTATVTNRGNVHILTSTIYRITNLWSNEIVEETALPLASILPDNSRKLQLQWLNPKTFGLFRAEIDISALQDDHAEHYETWFLRIPTLVFVVVLGTFVIVFLLTQLYIRRSVQKKIYQATNTKP